MKTSLFLCFLVLLPISTFASEFPEATLTHPFSKKTYQNIKYGEPYRGRSWRYRYLNRVVTVYNIEEREERLKDAPSFHENCHDLGDRFANWQYSKTFSRSISTGVDFELLGFGLSVGGDLSQDFEVSFQRWVIATEGIEAIHTPFMRYQVYKGESFIQTINLTTGEFYASPLERDNFFVTHVDPFIIVKRKVLQKCEN